MILNKIKISELMIYENKSIKQALEKINKTGQRCLVVIDNKKKLKGTIGDSDIRRSLLKNKTFNTVKQISNKNPFYIYKNKLNFLDIKKTIIEKRLDVIPILDKKKKVLDIYFLDRFKNIIQKKNNPVVVMAGGKGTRMAPFTNVLPKMLLPLNNKTVIECILDNFISSGYGKFFMCINYKADIIKSYLTNKKKYKIKYIEEKNPLGTVGGIKLIKNKITKDFFLINCDVLFDINLDELAKYHRERKNKLTIVAAKKFFKIPYGVCNLSKNKDFIGISEKPNMEILVNTGLYMLSPSVVNYIPKNKYFDFDDLINKLKINKMKTGVFEIDEVSWKDTGQWNEFALAQKSLDN